MEESWAEEPYGRMQADAGSIPAASTKGDLPLRLTQARLDLVSSACCLRPRRAPASLTDPR